MTLQFSPQQNAAWVHRRLLDFAQRLEQGIARPGECSCIFDAGGYARHSAQWFMGMARQAVRGKYVQAGRWGVVATYLQPLRRDLLQGSVRLAAHATRWRCVDRDLFACTGCASDLTAWIFQQTDLRYRLQIDALTRLQFMVSCWAHYAEYGFTSQTVGLGLNTFPLTADLRPDILVEAYSCLT